MNEVCIDSITCAIFTVNRHAKTAPNPSHLYLLKKTALEKMLKEGTAKKVGLHFSKNPKFSQQRSDVLVLAGNYYFHLPPVKEDFQLPHLGNLDDSYRNPNNKMSIFKAKAMLQQFTGIKEETEVNARRFNSRY